MAPGSAEQQFEERLSRLDSDIAEIITMAERNPGVVAAQGVRVQLLLSYLRSWRDETPKLRAVK